MSMVKEDLIACAMYIGKYHFPIDREDQTVYTYLKQFYEKYLYNIKNMHILSDGEFEEVNSVCESILKTIDLYNENNILQSYSILFAMLDHVKSHFLQSKINTFSLDNHFYRVQKCGIAYDEKKVGLLHCPFHQRKWISTSRFSLPGIPSTYMSTMPELAWYESRMPVECYIVQYSVNDAVKNKYSLLYLDYELWQWKSSWLREISDDETKNVEIYHQMKCFLYTIPLVTACSFMTTADNCSFREEYIIPQMLMSWMKQNTDMIGIIYNSSSPYQKTEEMNARNIVIPGTEFDENGYCKRLQQIFIHSNSPKYIKKNIIVAMTSIEDELEALHQLTKELQDSITTQSDEHVRVFYELLMHLCMTIETSLKKMQNVNIADMGKEGASFELSQKIIADFLGLYKTSINRENDFVLGIEKLLDTTPELAQKVHYLIKKMLKTL